MPPARGLRRVGRPEAVDQVSAMTRVTVAGASCLTAAFFCKLLMIPAWRTERGPSELYSQRQQSARICASGAVVNSSVLKNSSRKRPVNNPANPFLPWGSRRDIGRASGGAGVTPRGAPRGAPRSATAFRAQKFASARSLSIAFPNSASANSFLSGAFSFYSWVSRLASSTCSPHTAAAGGGSSAMALACAISCSAVH
jgi:hypothetical protein